MMDLSEEVNYWLAWYGKATAEWPWRFYILNVEQSAKTICPGASPARFAELLIAVSNTVEKAAANDSTDYVAFAKPPNGWKRGEKLAMRRLCAAVAKPDCSLSELGILLEKVSDPHPWPKPGRGGHGNPWEPTVFEWAKDRPLLTLVELIDRFKGGGALDVPFDEWRHIDGDFRPLAIFKLIFGSHILPRPVNGKRVYCPDDDAIQTTNCVALHMPRGSRDTARKSARTWQARNLLALLNSVYSQHSEVVQQAWSSADDPVFQLICNPTHATVRAARLFLWREINQQNRRLADKTGEVKPPATPKVEETPVDESSTTTDDGPISVREIVAAAEAYLADFPWPGLNKLMRAIRCRSKSNFTSAMNSSSIMQKKLAEHTEAKKNRLLTRPPRRKRGRLMADGEAEQAKAKPDKESTLGVDELFDRVMEMTVDPKEKQRLQEMSPSERNMWHQTVISDPDSKREMLRQLDRTKIDK